jgi:hypothetical protein
LWGVNVPSVFAMHRLADGRWELLGRDDNDPCGPSWRMVAIVDSTWEIADSVSEAAAINWRSLGLNNQ